MREIKFRAWDKRRKEYLSSGRVLISVEAGRQPKNSLIFLDILSDPDFFRDRFVIEQFTGLDDKNGKEICEGDILYFTVFDYNGYDTQHKGIVKWYGTRFMLWHDNEQEHYGLDWVTAQDDEPEIIGNIHENPELLEATK